MTDVERSWLLTARASWQLWRLFVFLANAELLPGPRKAMVNASTLFAELAHETAQHAAWALVNSLGGDDANPAQLALPGTAHPQ